MITIYNILYYFVIFGTLIIWFLIKEPEGLVRLLGDLRERIRVWPLRF